ncbi:PH domain-containing protein [Clostridium faecium]|uniref:PH domain-containing protein n=1 Tax=Clostridium faecium TaxID=2762223 RepID=A0ABR8YRA8_9CLOT|nr:PH domain-containing protein [Clostridium faecium]MBD8046798.1 PH domain-containing protein [Clostridium faecium]
MTVFTSKKDKEVISILLLVLLYNVLLVILMNNMHSYVVINLLRLIIIACNLYYFYYIFLWLSLKYELWEDKLIISGLKGLKKLEIPLKDIEGYTKISGKIRGVKLSGVATNTFALGRTVVKKVGTTRMFVTNNKNVIYLKTQDYSIAISPENVSELEELLNKNGIHSIEWETKFNKVNKLYKNIKYKLPLFLTSIVIIILTVNPLLLYVTQRLPDLMPITFDAKLKPVLIGTSRQFAFTQMAYGALNMGLLFCMYYASYFCAKYDKKTAYRYLYIALAVASVFLYMQIRMLLIAM